MTRTRQREGYINLIQCPDVSSSSDVRNPRFICLVPRRFPHSRRSYRPHHMNEIPYRVPQPSIDFLEFMMAHQELVPARNPAPNPNPEMARLWPSNLSTRVALISVAVIFLSSILILSLVYHSFPKLLENERQHIKLPWNIDEAKNLGVVLDRYKKDHYLSVLSGVFLTYIFAFIIFFNYQYSLQTFAIPGSIFLSILSGFLFNFYTALLLVCTCSAIGASLCFLLSQLLGRKLIWLYFPDKARKWAVVVDKHRENLFNYIVFLRVTPFLPNWFINLTAPVIGVPLVPFATGTFVGVAPPSFVAIQTGQTLHNMSASDATFSWTSIFWLGIFAVISLLPIFLKKQLKQKFQ